jgi:cbb3-type cytochrome oxidase cytochrome c subunit/mono/diheme cytochrome c family protein
MSYLVGSVAGVAFFVLSVAWLGVWPARALAEQARLTGPEHALLLTASELRGRAIYAREGCAYCHSQQIRFTNEDVTRFGSPTLAWESRGDTPQLMGTRRIGPDLSRAGGTRSADWHFAHLYSPRSVVPSSVMPAYRSLFAGRPDAPLQGAHDLVAYIETLGRARELQGSADVAAGAPDSHMRGLVHPSVLNAHPARARRTGGVPVLPADGDWDRGKALYAAKCAACHGETLAGDGPGTEALRPRATNLAAHSYAQERLVQVLWNGVAGTAMPAWRDLPLAELAALVRYVNDPRVLGFLRHDGIRLDAEVLVQGKHVYDANCAQCHGADGVGDGPAARLLPIAPTNFRLQRLWGTLEMRILESGIDGTSMAAWGTRLSAGEMTAVSGYIVQLYRDGLAQRDREGRR